MHQNHLEDLLNRVLCASRWRVGGEFVLLTNGEWVCCFWSRDHNLKTSGLHNTSDWKKPSTGYMVPYTCMVPALFSSSFWISYLCFRFTAHLFWSWVNSGFYWFWWVWLFLFSLSQNVHTYLLLSGFLLLIMFLSRKGQKVMSLLGWSHLSDKHNYPSQ